MLGFQTLGEILGGFSFLVSKKDLVIVLMIVPRKKVETREFPMLEGLLESQFCFSNITPI
jgi:hypothetical protein